MPRIVVADEPRIANPLDVHPSGLETPRGVIQARRTGRR